MASATAPTSGQQSLRYGNKVLLYCEARRGYVMGTNSALSPLGVKREGDEEALSFERAVFVILPGDGGLRSAGTQANEEVKFGQVVRLVHNMHRKAVAQNANLHAVVNKANQRVTLGAPHGSGAGDSSDKWRIMPRYRLRGEGERVCCFDHVVLQAASGEVAFLHVSSTRDEAADGCYEVNCGSSAEGFELRLYDGDESLGTRELRGGQCVVLHHKEENRRLAVDPRSGSCYFEPIAGMGEDGPLPTTAAASASAHNYRSLFILEFGDPRRGGIVEGGRRNMYRLKALCNAKYLSVRSGVRVESRSGAMSASDVRDVVLSGDDVCIGTPVVDLARYEVTLTGEAQDPSTLFAFHNAGDDPSNVMRNGSRVFVEAPLVCEGVWLAAGSAVGPQLLRELMSAPTAETKSLSVECREEKSVRDGLELQQLPDDEFEELSVVLSLLPPLQVYVSGMLRGELESSRVAQVLENVRQLRRVCFGSIGAVGGGGGTGAEADGELSGVGQLRLLRQGVPQLVVEIVRATLESPLIDARLLNTMEVVQTSGGGGGGLRSMASLTALHGDGFVAVKYSEMLELLNACFALVHAVVMGQPRHALELGQHLQFLVGCCRVLPAALLCVAEFYRNNIDLVSTPGDTKSLSFFLDMLHERGRDTAVLEVVTLFAMCGDVGIAEAQSLIVERVLRQKEVAKALLLPITMSGGVLHVGVPASYGTLRGERPVGEEGDAMTLVPLTRLHEVTSSAFIEQGRNAVVPYLTQAVLLLAAVCGGRNAASALAVQQLIPPELMLPLLEIEGVVPELHAALVRLFTLSLIDVAGSADLFERTRGIRHVIDDPTLTDSYTLEEEVPGILSSAKRHALRYLQGFKREELAGHGRVVELDSFLLLELSLAKRGVLMLDEYAAIVATVTQLLGFYGAGLVGDADERGDERSRSPQEVVVVEAMLHAMGLLNRLADFLLTRDVYDVVMSFVRGMGLRHVSQLLDLSPTTRLAEHSRRRVEVLQASAVDAKLNALFSLGQAERGMKEFDGLRQLLTVVMSVAYAENLRLRSAAIQLYCRLTNYPGELLLAVRRVQLLTSAASAEFYGRVKQAARDLQAFARGPLVAGSAVKCEAALARIEALLTQHGCGVMIEKIAMLRHAEVPQMLLDVLRGITLPPKEEWRLLVFSIVGLLQTMAQDPLVLEQLSGRVSSFVHLTRHDMDIVSLLRTLYSGRAALALQLPARVIGEVVACVSIGHSAAPAMGLLRDVLATKDAGGKYISRNQRGVWKALVADDGTSKMLRLRNTWTGRRGAAQRDQLLESDEYFNHSGRLRLHVSLLEVLFLVAKTNELVRPEEIRDEVFGPHGVDDLLEVVTNARLPAFYRYRYINLLQVTVIEDSVCVSTLFTHRLLPEFLRLCRVDVNHCLLLLDGSCADVADEELVRHVERGLLRRKPADDFQQAMELRRTGLDFYCQLVTHGILPCVRHLMMKFSTATARLSAQIREQLVRSLNELVDCVCDLLRQVFVLRSFAELAHFTKRMARKKAADFLLTASKHDFTGLGRWCDDLLTLAEGIPVESAAETESVDGGGAARVGVDEKALTGRWMEFVQRQLVDSRGLSMGHVYASGAGVILRSGRAGTLFVKTLIVSLRELGVVEQDRVLHLLRQVVSLEEGTACDDSSLLRFDSGESGDSGVLTLVRSQHDRQELMALYFSDQPHVRVMPAVTQIMASGSEEVRGSALRCALVLLDGGHRRMQESLYASVGQRSDEDLFVVLRSHLQGFRDALRSYRFALRRGAKEEALVVLGPLDRVRMLLRYIQLLCEGHFAELQHYLRAQPDNHVSVNVLESLVEVLSVLVDVVDANTVSTLMQLLATVTETIQGPCKANQDYFVTANVAELLTRLMVLPLRHETLEEEQVREVRAAALDVLLALIEGRMEVSFLGGLIAKLDLLMMSAAMQQSAVEYEARWGSLEEHSSSMIGRSFGFVKGLLKYVEKIYKSDEHDETSDELVVAVNIFIFFKTCLDLEQLVSYGGTPLEFTDRRGLTIREALRRTPCYRTVNQRVGMVEILRDGALERSYFRILSTSSDNLREYSKEEVIKSVDRTSDNKRLQDFFEQCNKLMLELDYYAEMRESPLLSFIHDYASEFDVIGLLVVFVINLIMLITTKVDPNQYDDSTPTSIQNAVRGLGIFLIVVQCMLFVNFFFGPTRVYLERRWLKWVDTKVEELLDEHRQSLAIDDLKEVDFLSEVTPVQHYVQSLWYILQYGKFYQLALFLVAAVLGYVQSPIWYSIQLLQITSKSTLLYNVILTIVTYGSSLLLTFILAVFTIYIFAMIFYFHFSELFNPYILDVPHLECDSLANCMLNTFESIRAQSGIGTNTIRPYFHTSDRLGYPYFFLSIGFCIIIKFIALRLVFGIIVDSFAQLREQREFMERDQEGKCFVCGIEQNEFDRVVPGGFEQHIRSEHNMWHYLFYLHGIRKKDKANLNGQESHVWSKMRSKESSFFPIGRAMMLQSRDLRDTATAEEEARGRRYQLLMERTVGKLFANLDEKLDLMTEQLNRVERDGQSAGGEHLQGHGIKPLWQPEAMP